MEVSRTMKKLLIQISLVALAAYGLWYAKYSQMKYEAKNLKMVEDWIKTIDSNQWKNYSQLGEDGILDTIFKNIGTTDKIYVEFGVENCMSQCNTRLLRETGWNVAESLLMDGGHENPAINLHKVIFWPSNIVSLFQRFGVPYEFDLLSVDTDTYDWFMLEAIFEAGYRPRVAVTEINSHHKPTEARSMMPPKEGESWQRWDGTAYHGSSILAISYLFNRFHYSLLFCNRINCFGVRDDALGAAIRRPFSDIYKELQNPGLGHKCDYENRSLAIIDPSGRWLGETDNGLGSPKIRYKGCAGGRPKFKPYVDGIPQAVDEQNKL